jgi:hypothetical protein
MQKPILMVCVLLVFGFGVARAQASETSSPLSGLGPIQPGDQLRLELATLQLIEGSFAGSRGDTVIVATTAGEERVPCASVRRLWVRGRSTKQYAKRGAIVGGIAGGLLFTFAAGMSGEKEWVLPLVGGCVFGGLLVGAPSALLGYAVPRWNLRCPAPATPSREKTGGPRRTLRPPPPRAHTSDGGR